MTIPPTYNFRDLGAQAVEPLRGAAPPGADDLQQQLHVLDELAPLDGGVGRDALAQRGELGGVGTRAGPEILQVGLQAPDGGQDLPGIVAPGRHPGSGPR